MRILVACEFSGAVRSRFRAMGHDAWSCDLLPAEDGSEHHYEGDVLEVIDYGWDLMIAHPPCTHLAVSGARHFAAKRASGVQQEALEFIRRLLDAPIEKIALENPVSIISSHFRKPEQIVQPWNFGDFETKATCLWLKNLRPLVKTFETIEAACAAAGLPAGTKPRDRVHKMAPGPNRWKERSRTYRGIADAIALQWGSPAFAFPAVPLFPLPMAQVSTH